MPTLAERLTEAAEKAAYSLPGVAWLEIATFPAAGVTIKAKRIGKSGVVGIDHFVSFEQIESALTNVLIPALDHVLRSLEEQV